MICLWLTMQPPNEHGFVRRGRARRATKASKVAGSGRLTNPIRSRRISRVELSPAKPIWNLRHFYDSPTAGPGCHRGLKQKFLSDSGKRIAQIFFVPIAFFQIHLVTTPFPRLQTALETTDSSPAELHSPVNIISYPIHPNQNIRSRYGGLPRTGGSRRLVIGRPHRGHTTSGFGSVVSSGASTGATRSSSIRA
jgi:hypothetical protein